MCDCKYTEAVIYRNIISLNDTHLFRINIFLSSLHLARVPLLWMLFFLFLRSIMINTVFGCEREESDSVNKSHTKVKFNMKMWFFLIDFIFRKVNQFLEDGQLHREWAQRITHIYSTQQIEKHSKRPTKRINVL